MRQMDYEIFPARMVFVIDGASPHHHMRLQEILHTAPQLLQLSQTGVSRLGVYMHMISPSLEGKQLGRRRYNIQG